MQQSPDVIQEAKLNSSAGNRKLTQTVGLEKILASKSGINIKSQDVSWENIINFVGMMLTWT